MVDPAPGGPYPLIGAGAQGAGGTGGGGIGRGTGQYRQYLLPKPLRNRGSPAIGHWGLAFLSQLTHTADRPYKTMFWLL